MLMGFYLAHQADPIVTAEDKTKMEDLVGKRYRGPDNKLTVEKILEAAHLVRHAEVAAGKGKSYITISMAKGEGEAVLEMLEKAWGKLGKVQVDPPPPKPVMKELKEAERRARNAMQ